MSEQEAGPGNPTHTQESVASERTAAQSEAPPPRKIDVKATRLSREFRILDLKQTREQRAHLKYAHHPDKQSVVVGKIVSIVYGDSYPFCEPKVQIMLDKDERYQGHISLFDLSKLQFRDIMKEDYHPSLNFAEIAERSFQFIQKNVIIAHKGQAVTAGPVFAAQSSLLGCLSPNILATTFYALLILAQALASGATGEDDVQTKQAVGLLKSFIVVKKTADPHEYKNVDPFQDNMLVFTLYKVLANVFAFFNGGKVPDYERNRISYALILKGLALALQCVMVNVPLQRIVMTVYKKNSRMFQDLLAAVCVTSCIQFTHCGLTIDYPSILFLGTTLWCHSLLLTDSVTGCLLFYGLSLNCSLDALILAPFLLYRVICKTVKEVRKLDCHGRASSWTSSMNIDTGGLDMTLVQTLLYKLQSSVISFLFGFFLPWIPYFFNVFKYPSGMSKVPRKGTFSFMYDHVAHSLYNGELVNGHNAWYLLVHFMKTPEQAHAFFDKLQIPLFMLLGWSFLVNTIIILITRGNNKISSHKKHLLQLVLILLFDYALGSPKLQSQEGVLAIVCSLLLILYAEYTGYAIVFGVAAHLTYLSKDQYLSSISSAILYFIIFAFHQMFAAVALRQFLHFCMAKQVGGASAVIDEESSNANDKTNPELIKKHQKTINEAFRANYSLVRQMTVRGRYGLGKVLQTYQNEAFVLDMALTVTVSLAVVALESGLVEQPLMAKVVRDLPALNLFVKSMAVIMMTFESLMVHSMGPARAPASGKKINDGSGPFINKYNRMEPEKKERDGDVMGLQDADKTKVS